MPKPAAAKTIRAVATHPARLLSRIRSLRLFRSQYATFSSYIGDVTVSVARGSSSPATETAVILSDDNS